MEQQPLPQPQYFLFIIILGAFIGGLYLILYGLGIAAVSSNWPENRCKPQVMPFASLYGYNTAENFNYCMKHIIADQAGQNLGPIYQILSTFVGTLSTLLASANSLRLSMATLVGGITNVFQEFSERINALMTRIRISTLRMKLLFGRLFATFYSMIYMGMSGVTAVSNFGDTFLFKFLDTFCFDPETPIHTVRGTLPAASVQIGDVLVKTGATITATYSFIADGQPMVRLGDTTVSTNHYVFHGEQCVKASEHPDAVAAADWTGGAQRPLICFNTSDHRIPVGAYLFLDYDETDESNGATMAALAAQVNGLRSSCSDSDSDSSDQEYSPGFAPDTEIALGRGRFKSANEIKLGDTISTGRIIGIVQKQTTHFSRINGELISSSSLIWDASTDSWKRGIDLPYPKGTYPNKTTLCFFVSPTATIETRQGTHIRDTIEVLSPDAEAEYSKQIAATFSK